MSVTGGCQCGAVRYSVDIEKGTKVICHCKPCQKRTASAFSSNIVVPRTALKVTTGTTRTYPHLGDSGKLYHHNFCTNCGTEVFGMPDAAPDLVSVKAGSLDNEFRNIGPMNAEVYIVNRNNYIDEFKGLTQYEGMIPL